MDFYFAGVNESHPSHNIIDQGYPEETKLTFYINIWDKKGLTREITPILKYYLLH